MSQFLILRLEECSQGALHLPQDRWPFYSYYSIDSLQSSLYVFVPQTVDEWVNGCDHSVHHRAVALERELYVAAELRYTPGSYNKIKTTER